MGGVAKSFKKVFKGVGKVLGKVVKKVVNVGKKIAGGIGKVMGRLGPIGTIAMGFVAPYAVGALAGANLGWASTLAKGVMQVGQTVSSAISAPFRIAGQALGKGVSSLGQSVGGGFTTITDKISSTLGYKGGSIADGAKGILRGVTDSARNILAPGSDTIMGAGPENLFKSASSQLDAGSFKIGLEGAGADAGSVLGDMGFRSGVTTPGGEAMLGFEGSGQTTALTNRQVADLITPEFKGAGTREDLLKGVRDPNRSFLDPGQSLGSGFDFKLPSIPMPAPIGQAAPLDTSGYNVKSAAAGASRGTGGQGESFRGQAQTGLLRTEDFAANQFSLLNQYYNQGGQ